MRHVCQMTVNHPTGAEKVQYTFTRLIDDATLLSVTPGEVVRVGGHAFLYWPASDAVRVGVREISVAPEDVPLDDVSIQSRYCGRQGALIYEDAWVRLHDLDQPGPGLRNGLVQPGLPEALNPLDVVFLAHGHRPPGKNYSYQAAPITLAAPAGMHLLTDAPAVIQREDGAQVALGGTFAMSLYPSGFPSRIVRLRTDDAEAAERYTLAATEALLAHFGTPDDKVVEIFDVLYVHPSGRRRRRRR